MSADALLPPDRTGVVHRRWHGGAPIEEPTQPGMMVLWNDWRPIGHVLRLPDGSVQRVGPEAQDHAPSPAPPHGSVSVVICTRDRPDDIARCLASLRHQTRVPDEVVVVDNASRDQRTREAVLAAGATYLREDREGLDFARNTGVAAATGDLIIFTDDDVLLDPHWLERMTAAFDDPMIGAVTGLVLPAELASAAQFHFEGYWGFNQGYRRRDVTRAIFESYGRLSVFPAWDLGAGASMGFRRAVFADAGLFDERLGAGQSGCSDDSEYWYRLLHHGWTCRYEPHAVAYHYHRREDHQLAHQIRQYMRGHVAALFVQYERTGRTGNLWRAFWDLPKLYAERWLKRTLKGRKRESDRFLGQEISGCFSGVLFYLRARKPKP